MHLNIQVLTDNMKTIGTYSINTYTLLTVKSGYIVKARPKKGTRGNLQTPNLLFLSLQFTPDSFSSFEFESVLVSVDNKKA